MMIKDGANGFMPLSSYVGTLGALYFTCLMFADIFMLLMLSHLDLHAS
jgi:hypothetical protein